MRAFTGRRDWGRLLTAMLTPFRPDGTVNYPELKRLAAFLVDVQHNDGIVVSGTTAESPTLTEVEKLKVLEAILSEVGDRASVVFGAGTYNTAESIHLAQEGQREGAHGIMLVNPYYSRPGQAGLEAHFTAIANETTLPVMIYNIQSRTSINLETETLMRLAHVPNIVAVKEASGSIGQIADVCSQAPEGFRVYSGDDGMTLPGLSVGGHGVVSVAGHVVGAEIKQMIDAFSTDPSISMRMHRQLIPIFKALFASPSPVPVKYACSLVGFECETVRLPLVTLTDAEKQPVRKCMIELGKLGPIAAGAM